MLLLLLFPLGWAAGCLAAFLACWLLAEPTAHAVAPWGLLDCRGCGRTFSRVHQLSGGLLRGGCVQCGLRDGRWPIVAALATGLLFAAFGWLLLEQGCQTVTEVRPELELWQQRLPVQLLFLFLLVVVTLTDLLDYAVPDLVVGCGTLLAVLLATWSGELQMIHIWVSWDAELVMLYGPYLPEWMKQHQHLHGLAWSTAGLAAGAGVMAVIRWLGGAILGYPAVGLGDVTLMAMIGAFMGWQPTLCVLAIAPLSGLVIGVLVRVITGRTFVAFGPYLTCSAAVVLCTWRLLWEQWQLRTVFSHWPTVVGLTGGALLGLALLLGAIRLFRGLPVQRLR